ncbi:hypothetical protein EIP86_002139 [Pleurotus ostreatoroseus]|nr:hypothetical protein EIP86_002139 [Pleurotus ostreatoroseus]
MPVAPGPSNQLMKSTSKDPHQDAQQLIANSSVRADDTELPPAPQVHVNGKPAQDSTVPKRPKSSASSVSPDSSSDVSGWDPADASPTPNGSGKPAYRRSRSYVNDGSPKSKSPLSPQSQDSPHVRQRAYSTSRATHGRHSPNGSPNSPKSGKVIRRTASGEKYHHNHSPAGSSISPLAYERGHPLAPIPGSPYNTDNSPPGSPSKKSIARLSTSSKHSKERDREKERGGGAGPSAGLGLQMNGTAMRDSPRRKSSAPLPSSNHDDGLARSRSSKSTKSAKSASFVPYRSPQPQSLNAALEKLAFSDSLSKDKQKGGEMLSLDTPKTARHSTSLGRASGMGALRRLSTEPTTAGGGAGAAVNGSNHPSPVSHSTSTSTSTSASALMGKSKSDPGSQHKNSLHEIGSTKAWASGMIGKEISSPVFDPEATQNMSPVKMRNAGRPILVEQPAKDKERHEAPWDAELGMYANRKRASLNTG